MAEVKRPKMMTEEAKKSKEVVTKQGFAKNKSDTQQCIGEMHSEIEGTKLQYGLTNLSSSLIRNTLEMKKMLALDFWQILPGF